MKMKLTAAILLAGFLAACGTEEQQAQPEKAEPETAEENQAAAPASAAVYPQLSNEVADNEELVAMETSMGTIKIKLFPDYAPKAVENFLTLAEDGYYDGLLFHRVIEDFMLQSGDPTGTGGGGESIYGESFEDEFSDNLLNLRGALSMANAGPGTNGSQFFIVQAKEAPADSVSSDRPDAVKQAYAELGGTPWLDGKHTVFGQVIEGMDVVDAIAAVDKQQDRPVEDVTIDSIEVLSK
ncbi:peptidyl-prolyl cis-trans isomerase B (cyclophilin B) [Planomicrobium koreense]|uniref:Peptidyl-prolyl cis-trans isomerase n=1 Tax=Planococcus koreensis TaxID=112331 RepID=A0A7W8CWX1_9BACL|nr:peptidylprolyl isomerase [Planococcus koreensis]MBB5181968.1 peptidyl-prolyl cis-trans isomerase B (cyclophilin B) [Planococcus koreensis]